MSGSLSSVGKVIGNRPKVGEMSGEKVLVSRNTVYCYSVTNAKCLLASCACVCVTLSYMMWVTTMWLGAP